ncbi:hypothetical protein [Aquabacterium sp. CECT 9606]|uniref:hypothetical protein n=1 Tax=Aquabacterium sp. CECT 9606 TaxID=2845822 RepID=UPI001E3DD8EC|nr:hypothetical protein [Aquabacterium sp. CECT 9606]CAH0356176.1 hypothetical protein AQB9606_04599 [Aquabacterium sp. CECT 9606]
MKNPLQRAADASSFEGPKLTIDLAKIFGFAPISFEIPLPKISNPFGNQLVDPLSLPFKKWKIIFKAWRDGRRGLPHPDQPGLTSYEDEILAQCDKKLISVDRAIQEHRLGITQALKAAENHSFDASDSIVALKNRFLDWLSACSDELRIIRQKHAKALTDFREKEKALDALVTEAGLKSRIPHFMKPPLERWADIVFAALIDVGLSFWFISAKQDIDRLQAIGFSSVSCFINIAVGFILGKYIIHRAQMASRPTPRAGFTLLAILFIAAIMMGNVMFAMWRDQGHQVGLNPLAWLPLSAFSFFLLTLNLAIFTFTILKTLYEFNPSHPGHEERWRDFKLAEHDVNELRLIHEMQMRQMRRTGYATVEQVRQDAGAFLMHLKNAKAGLASYLANLKAHTQYWPKLMENIAAFAETFIKLYREHCFAAQRKNANAKLTYPLIQPQRRDFSILDDEQTCHRALAILGDTESDLKKFQSEFENVIAPMVRKKIDDEARLVIESTSSAQE